jgi:hypothetical protein
LRRLSREQAALKEAADLVEALEKIEKQIAEAKALAGKETGRGA